MKPIRFILLMMLFAVATSLFAQSPQRFNYQAVARDASGNPISEKTLSVRITIVDGSAGGTSLYAETFSPTTSKQGLFSIQVGGGTVTSGTFNSIVWGSAPKFLKVEIDPAGGSAFALLGTSQLLSVPYAFAADKLSSPLSIKDLSDVSDTAPSVDQVLKWDGTSWTPGNGAGGIVTSSALSGDGSAATPLTIAQQNATSGQVLQWNGADWKPATISGGVGDNWGTQNVVGNATLSGAGTSASPLGIAPQGATTGQVLKYNGSAWAPAADGGDNWGTAKVNASSQFGGDGTPVNPLSLAQQGATTGQFLKWSGTSWIPGDGGGGLTLPASGNVADPAFGLQVQNTSGTAIVGIQAQAGSTASKYGVEGRVLVSTGANTAGVMGHHFSTGAFGYGVLGLHDGNGVGVYGEATGATGYGVSGRSNGANGAGLYGLATGATGKGVVGNAGGAGGIGVYGGSATTTGYSGWFDGGQLLAKMNGTAAIPNLYIWEDDANDKTRVRFNNGITNEFWDLGARTTSSAGTDLDKFTVTHFSQGDILTVSGDKRVGINLGNPSVELDVNGSIKLNGSLTANGTVGTAGQVLQSTGLIATWGSGTTMLFNNTALHDQTSDRNTITGQQNTLPGLQTLTTFTTTGVSKVIMTFSHGQLVSDGSGDVDLQVEIGLKNPTTGAIINRAIINDFILNNKKGSVTFTHHCFLGGATSFIPYVFIGSMNSGKFNALSANGAGQVTVQVIPQ